MMSSYPLPHMETLTDSRNKNMIFRESSLDLLQGYSSGVEHLTTEGSFVDNGTHKSLKKRVNTFSRGLEFLIKF